MMFKQRYWMAVLVLVLVVAVVGCDRDDDDGLAPDSVAGQTYQLTAAAADVSGMYQAGTSTVTFVGGGYGITNQAGIPLDTGTYAYLKSSTDADSATITLTSIAGFVTTCNVTYLTANTGSFSLSAVQGTLTIGTARGTFTKS